MNPTMTGPLSALMQQYMGLDHPYMGGQGMDQPGATDNMMQLLFDNFDREKDATPEEMDAEDAAGARGLEAWQGPGEQYHYQPHAGMDGPISQMFQETPGGMTNHPEGAFNEPPNLDPAQTIRPQSGPFPVGDPYMPPGGPPLEQEARDLWPDAHRNPISAMFSPATGGRMSSK